MEVEIFQPTTANFRINLDPRTKLLLLLVIGTIMISGRIAGHAAYARIVLAGIPLLLLLTGNRIKGALLYTIVYSIAWMAEVFLVYSTTGIANILIVMLSGLATRFIPCAVLGYYVVSTTRVSEFVAAMERMRVSRKIIIPLSVMFRFFPTIGEESRSINDAMRMRALGVGSTVKGPMAMLEYRMVPLLMSIVKIGEELSASALTRGLGTPGKRTNICRIGFGFWDVFFVLVTMGATAYYFLAGRY